ncbi:MAG TPA: lasso peptide biosynthesis B2 protein [Longimicrobiales bacterium]
MRRPPGVTKCLLLLASSDICLRWLGFARTMRVARSLAGSHEADVPDPVIRQTLKNIIVATALYPGRSKCLEQTVASFVLLRRRGARVQMRFGVQPYPFFAHAWLEMNGHPLTESAEVVARFALLPDPAL